MGVAEVDERHHVVVGVDVEPDARLAEPVGEPHAEHVGVEAEAGLDVAGEAVDVAELARRRRGGRSSTAGHAAASGRPRSPGRGSGITCTGRPSGSSTKSEPSRSSQRDTERRRDGRARRRASSPAPSSKAKWSWPGLPPSTSSRQYGSSLHASSARPPSRERSTSPNWSCHRADASSRSATRRQTWSSRWSSDHGSRPSATIRSASSSGIASATWSVWAETCICSPGPARSTSHSSIVFVRRPMPGDLDLDDVTRLHRARVRGRAREDRRRRARA